MNHYKYFLTLLFCLLFFFGFSQKETIKMEAQEVALTQVIQQLENEYGYLFSYKETDINAVFVTPPVEKKSIEDFLKYILKNKNLQFEIVRENFVIITKKDLSELIDENPKSLLCGKIIDQVTQLPLPFANVYLQKNNTGVSTSEAGDFEFSTSITASDTLVISYVGYQEHKILATQFAHSNCPTIALKYFEFEGLVIVQDYLTDGVSLNNNGAHIELRPERIGNLPGQVEPDILKTIQFLPGVSSADGSASNINIRGGTPDQNLILWEDIPIYHSAHYFGMISAFNPYIIKNAKVYRGGFDANFGGRISGVIDLTSDDFSMSENKFDAGVNFINVFGNGKIALLKDKASVVFSVRRSISDWWDSPTFSSINRRIHQGVLFDVGTKNQLPPGVSIDDEFAYFDSNLKVSFQASAKDEISISGLYSNNDYVSELKENLKLQKQSDTLYLESSGVSLAWTHRWNQNFSTKVVGLISDYHYDYNYKVVTLNQSFVDKAGLKKSKINDQQFHVINTFQTPKNNHIELGYQLAKYDVGFQIIKANQDNPQVNESKAYQSNLHVIYGSWGTAKSKTWGFNGGLRFSYLESEKSNYFEPRLRLWYRPNEQWNFYLNTGKYFQFLSQLIEIEGDNASIETPVWVLAGQREVPILAAVQHQVGTVFQKNNWLIDFQLYLKNMDGLTSLATGFDEDIAGQFHLGNAKIRGLDVLVKKRWKNFRTWMSYAYSQIDYEFPTFFDTNFSPRNHQPHTFHLVNMWKYKSFEFSLGWKIGSGSPYSNRENFRIKINSSGMGSSESIIPETKKFNDQRLAAQHQLDASVNYNFYLKKSQTLKGSIGLSLINIYNQRNIYNRSFFIDNRPNELPELRYTNKSDLGFTPNLMVKFEW